MLASTAHTVYCIASDNTLWYSDDYTKGWTRLLNWPGTTITAITAARWPGPSGNLYLFAASPGGFFRYDRDSGTWTAMPALP